MKRSLNIFLVFGYSHFANIPEGHFRDPIDYINKLFVIIKFWFVLNVSLCLSIWVTSALKTPLVGKLEDIGFKLDAKDMPNKEIYFVFKNKKMHILPHIS